MSLRVMMTTVLIAFTATAALAVTPPQQTPPPATAKPPAAAPGIVPQEQETHGDWRVVCATPKDQKVCVFSQQISDQASKQRVLGIEFRAASADSLMMTIILPFGLAVDKPVRIKIDEGSTMSLPFKTCLQVGCMLNTTWDSSIVAALRKGTAIFVNATTADTGQDVALRVSLNGFGSALDRTLVLVKK